ncbi:MAG: glycoside hydrolase family 130 protein [Flavobacteriaceae bacterium]
MRLISTLLYSILFANVFGVISSCESSASPVTINEDSWMLGPFVKLYDENPILTPSPELTFIDPVTGDALAFEEKNVLNPAAIVKDGKVHLIYRAQDSLLTSRLALAISENGIHFEKTGEPIFFPEKDKFYELEWPGGVEDPRIVGTEDGGYFLTYTAYDGKTARLLSAYSKDLVTFKRYGSVFKDSVYSNMWSKSGAPIVRQRGERFVMTKINGYYYMYFGDTNLYLARSKTLVDWEVLEDAEKGTAIEALQPRPGYFDSRLVEPGPFALLTAKGVLMIYNASNAKNFNEQGLEPYTYAAGQALFDAAEPWRLIDRSDSYFIYPEADFEKEGEVDLVCFVEGLVYFQNKYYLYYGTADSKIGVAITN